MRHAATTAALAALLLGCASPMPDNAPRFSAAEPPAPGLARVYVLRPAVSEQLEREAPTLSLNAKPLAKLVHASYTQLGLAPGRYTATVTAGSLDTSAWSASRRFEFEPDRVYFLAIWMDVTIERGTTMVALPGTQVPTVPVPSASLKASGTRFELVPASQVKPLIDGLRYLTPENTGITPEAGW